MSTTVGLERLQRPIAACLEEAASNLLAAANEIDALPTAPAASREALETLELDARRIRHDLHAGLERTRRAGPDRVRLLAVVSSSGAMTERLRDLAWTWSRCPLSDAVDVLGALRDCVRACAHGVERHDDRAAVAAHVERCEERERELRACLRRARVTLLVLRGDPAVALCANRLLGRIDAAVDACVALRSELQRHALA